jgi:hypothetical protein
MRDRPFGAILIALLVCILWGESGLGLWKFLGALVFGLVLELTPALVTLARAGAAAAARTRVAVAIPPDPPPPATEEHHVGGGNGERAG